MTEQTPHPQDPHRPEAPRPAGFQEFIRPSYLPPSGQPAGFVRPGPSVRVCITSGTQARLMPLGRPEAGL